MATMIPTRIPEDAPNSERRIFDLLRSDPDTRGWTVLHSLGLAHRGNRPYGEIDFVVMVPGAGIVCLEIKGGRVRCENGVWYTMNQKGGENRLGRSPVMQAREGMFALMNALRRHFGDGSQETSVLTASAVVFPDVPAPPPGIEAETWEFIDRQSLTARPISRTVQVILSNQRRRLGRPDDGASGSRVLGSIRSFLRPDFDLVVARSTTIARAEEQLVRLTEGQYDIIDSVELNDRCVVAGAAGTGKTLVALEIVRRAARDGQRPLLICYNRLLGRWLENELRGTGAVVGSYHRILRRLILESSVRDVLLADVTESGPDPDFGEWPGYALEALGERAYLGDMLVVDEAQDLATDQDLCVLDAMLQGGLAGGRWVMLGDFTRQAIFGGVCEEQGFAGFQQLLRDRAPHFALLHLNRNCRNTRQIAEETAMLSGFERMPYRLNAADGPAVDYRFWQTRDDQLNRLAEAVSDLLRDGLAPEQIVILSPVRLEHSVATRLVSRGFRVVEVNEPSQAVGGSISFATMQAFKGMESPVAILTDLRGMEEADRHSLLYVAMSRARTALVMLVHQSFRPHVQAAMRRRLSEQV
jgi:hypothetical protein